MVHRHFPVAKEELDEFCRRHEVERLSLFGSVLREDFGPDSDIDILIEFAPGTVAGYLTLAAMDLKLGELLGRKVDIRTPAELSEYFRQEVLETAQPEYVRE